MKILEKATTPKGMDIQLEDWSSTYSFAKENATIGFYPMAQESIYNEDYPHFPPYPKKGQTFRASLDFPSETEAQKAFNSIASGEKSFLHYMEYYSNERVITKDNFLKAIAG